MYQVFAFNQYEASSPEEAVKKMIAFLDEYRTEILYVVQLPDGSRVNIQASELK